MLHAKRSGSELLFRSKFGVLAQPVAIALDRDDDGMVQQTVEVELPLSNRTGRGLITADELTG